MVSARGCVVSNDGSRGSRVTKYDPCVLLTGCLLCLVASRIAERMVSNVTWLHSEDINKGRSSGRFQGLT